MKIGTFSKGLAVAAALITAAGVENSLAGKLYASDPTDGVVVYFSPKGEERTAATVDDAEGIAFDSAGVLYASDFHRSVVYALNGRHGLKRVASGKAIEKPSALLFDSADNLFVAHDGTRPGIAMVTPDGIVTSFADGVAPGGLAFDSAGNLYASDAISGSVLKYAPDGSGTTFASGFIQPVDVKFDTLGNLYVSDAGAGIIYKIAPDGTSSEFASGLSQPMGLAFQRDGTLFVADPPNIDVFSTTGEKSIFVTGFSAAYLIFRREAHTH